MISREVIQKVLEAGVQAPSGSNSQPWRFEVAGDIVSIIMLPEKDHPILNFRNRGTLLAHGALIENIVIVAAHYKLKSEINLFPAQAAALKLYKMNANLVAKIAFKENSGDGNEKLFEAIWKRATNRKPYEKRKIPEEIKQKLAAIPVEIGEYGVVMRFADEPAEIKTIADASSANEIVMLENQSLHELFINEIVWTEKEEKAKKSGLYFKTMELKPPQAAALKLFQSWPVMRFFNRLGAARGIAKGNAKVYARCGAYGAVMCDNDDRAFVGLGRVIERAWLMATSMGLSFHLQTGVNFLWEALVLGKSDVFSREHAEVIEVQYKKMLDIFGADQKLLPAVFRLGYDGEPSARSSRKTPEVVFR